VVPVLEVIRDAHRRAVAGIAGVEIRAKAPVHLVRELRGLILADVFRAGLIQIEVVVGREGRE